MCPFCPYAAEMNTSPEEDKLFHCANEDCKTVSCRLCQRVNHIPLTCEENQKENVLDVKHTIEEKMTEALLRECWKCKKKFFKTEGVSIFCFLFYAISFSFFFFYCMNSD